MKYSLRSLMTFSIRDLFWITVVAALVLAWWVDRNRLSRELRSSVEYLYADPFMVKPGEGQAAREIYWRYHPEKRKMPNSQAPAKIMPKN